MDTIMNLLTENFGAMGPVVLVGGLGFVLILATIPFMLNQRKDPLEKLRESAAAGRNTASAGQALRASKGNDKLQKYSTFLEPQNAEEYSAVRKKLMQAGYRSKEAVRYFHFAQFALGVVFLIGGVVYYMMNFAGKPDTTTQDAMMYILGPGVVGYMLPKYWVTKRQQQRQEEITSGFPDALDMMLVCVEAGQSLDQSIIRVSRELRASYPSLSDEFEIVSYEIKAGKDKPTVLADMGERCGVADISSFVTVLVQSATFGTSIAEALRVYAEEMRDKRVMRAEEKANKLPTKMTLVTMMLTVPPLLIILVGPSVVGIQNLGNM
ncbi:MAG: type II secretion system F family protein [Rhodobacterales bacterium]|nr:type II secretion system F family protein [Rhodobacterales bacterium]MDX5412133.1 type II secretion system F family protein [Rhodobacterales bacterium]